MRMLNTGAWLLLIVLMTMSPKNLVLWLLLVLAAGLICYITKENEPTRTRNTDKLKR